MCSLSIIFNKSTIIKRVPRNYSHNTIKFLRLVAVAITALIVTGAVILIYSWSPLVLLGILAVALANKIVRNWKVVDYEYKKEEDAA